MLLVIINLFNICVISCHIVQLDLWVSLRLDFINYCIGLAEGFICRQSHLVTWLSTESLFARAEFQVDVYGLNWHESMGTSFPNLRCDLSCSSRRSRLIYLYLLHLTIICIWGEQLFQIHCIWGCSKYIRFVLLVGLLHYSSLLF